MANGKRAFWTAVMLLAAAVFACTVGYLGKIAYTYWADSHRYDEISHAVFTPAGESELAKMSVDWAALRKINPDVVAWVYVPDSPISYPVCWVKGDNTKYLDMNFDGAQGVFTGAGAIFLDGDAQPDFSCPANFLFGHHMRDGSMFACLSDFAAEEEFERHRTVYLLTPARNYEYRSFALVRTVGTEYLVVHDFADKAERAEYVKDKEERSMAVPADGYPAPASVSKILALSTCDYHEDNGRAILFSQLMDTATPSQDAENVVGDAEGYASPE